MKTLALLSLACLFLPARALAQDAVDIRVISLPARLVPDVRLALGDEVKGKELAAFDSIMKLPEVKEITRVRDTVAWDDVTKDVEKPIGMLGKGIGDDTGWEANTHIRFLTETMNALQQQRLDVYLDMPANASGSRYVHCGSRGVDGPVRKGRWQHRGEWTSGKDAWMIWQHISGTGDTAAQEAALRKDCYSADLQFFQLPAADIALLGKSGTGTRQNAAKWVMGRAIPWKGLRVHGAFTTHRRGWKCIQVKLEDDGGDAPAKREDGITVDILSSRKEDRLTLDLALTLSLPGKENLTGKQVLEDIGWDWNFAILENLGPVNVVVYREITP